MSWKTWKRAKPKVRRKLMDKERLEELKKLCDHVTSASLYASDKYMETAGALPELIAEVEFLTKVAEQAKEFSTLVLGTANDEPTIKNDEEGCWDYIGDSYAELAQYLKRGKE
jgi:hypothetical protein